MSDKKIIVVPGAGSQVRGLIDSILNDASGEFGVRILARNPSLEKYQAFAARGAEIVQGDVYDVISLSAAYKGGYGAYTLSFFWDGMDVEKEFKAMRNQADAAEAAGLEHIICSTLPDTRAFLPVSDTRIPMIGKYRVPHFDAKAETRSYFNGLPVTFLYVPFYWDNLVNFGMGPKPNKDGVWSWAFPMGQSPLCGIAAEDIGRCALGIFQKPVLYRGRTIGIAGESLTIQEMGDFLSDILGVGEISYYDAPPDEYASWFPGARELANMFVIYRDFPEALDGMYSPDLADDLLPEGEWASDFEGWAKKNREALLAAGKPAPPTAAESASTSTDQTGVGEKAMAAAAPIPVEESK